MEYPLEYYSYENIPLNRDIYAIQHKDYKDFSRFWRFYLDSPDRFEVHPNHVIGVVRVCVRKVEPTYLVIEVFLDTSLRFHSTVITLPKSDFIYCLENYNYQKQPILVLSDKWIKSTLYSNYSMFCMVDAIGVKKTILEDGYISQERLRNFTRGINHIARRYPTYTFFSFGDSVVVKGSFKGARFQFNTFKPETLLQIAIEIQDVFMKTLGYCSYGVFSQGLLYDFNNKGVKKSFLGNHYSLGSLGTPFSEIFEIDEAARKNGRNGVHKRYEFYMTDYFFRALELKGGAGSNLPSFRYNSKMSFLEDGYYYALNKSCLEKFLDSNNKRKFRFNRLRLVQFFNLSIKRFFHNIKVNRFFRENLAELNEMVERGPSERAE